MYPLDLSELQVIKRPVPILDDGLHGTFKFLSLAGRHRKSSGIQVRRRRLRSAAQGPLPSSDGDLNTSSMFAIC
jgi:hypothetical protein